MESNKNNLITKTTKKSDIKTSTDDKDLDGDNKKISSDSVLMAPIRALLSAQAIREKASFDKAEELASRGREGDLCVFLYGLFHVMVICYVLFMFSLIL